jgi:hypothetical protein
LSNSKHTKMHVSICRSFVPTLLAPGASIRSASQAATDHRGGTLQLTAQTAAQTIEPQINCRLEFFRVIEICYDGLINFVSKRVGNYTFDPQGFVISSQLWSH